MGKMILTEGTSINELLRYHENGAELGRGINLQPMDWAVRYKQGQINVILGHDNVGKTFWCLWYFLCLSSHHGITWTLYLAENKVWAAQRDLIQMYSGKSFMSLTKTEIMKYQSVIENWFKFVDNSKLYTPEVLLDVFAKCDTDAFFIDPFTALDREFGYEANYRFLNATRQFCNSTNKTIYLSTHPNTEAGRSSRIFPKDHVWEGHLMPPMKDHVEGGKAFSNRVDDVLIIHRLLKHRELVYTTMVEVAKVRDIETGGHISAKDDYVMCNFNSGLGFTVGGLEGIKRHDHNPQTQIHDEENLPL